MSAEELLEIITRILSPPVITLILAFTFVGLLTNRNQGWIYLLFGWFVNLVYLATETYAPVKTMLGFHFNHILSANLSHITSVMFLAFAFYRIRLGRRWVKTHYAYILGLFVLLWPVFMTLHYQGTIRITQIDHQVIEDHFVALNIPLVLFSAISIVMSGLALDRYLSNQELKRVRRFLTAPWLAYAALQFAYFLKLSPDKIWINLAFASALFSKSVIAYGLFIVFKQQTELAQVSRDEKRQLLVFSWFSHELKTPAFAIRATAGAIKKKLANNDYWKVKNLTSKLVTMTNQLGSVVESVLIASEPLNRDELAFFPINEVIDEALFSVRRIYSIKTGDVSKEYSGKMIVCGNRMNFVQVFTNLIKNAIEASKPSGQTISDGTTDDNPIPIRIKLRLDTRRFEADGRWYVRARVVDFGPGISEDIRNNIFEPYFSTKKGINRGLGLWVVRNFVEMFGGHVKVESPVEDLGIGTAFSVLFPLVRDVTMNPERFWQQTR